MTLEFEFVAGDDFDFARAFAERFNLRVIHNQVVIPDRLGSGYIKEVYLGDGLKLCLHQYQLTQPLVLKRLASSPHDALTIKFSGIRIYAGPDGYAHEPLVAHHRNYAVEVTTSNLFAKVTIPSNQAINFLIITIPRQTLLGLLRADVDQDARSIGTTLTANQSFVFHETMTPEMERILVSVSAITESTKLPTLLYQTRTQELIYLLFAKLLTRSTGISIPVNQADADKIYAVRAAILADLSVTPQLFALARHVGMSETKLKRLFRQVFGDSIYNYYQAARMNEAARLLFHVSVAETGYQLGFTNLSHFSRLFEKHHRVKPKRYKDTLRGVQ